MTPFDITLPVIESHDDDIVGSDVCNDAQVQFDFGSTTLPVIARDADILLSRTDRRIEELGSEHRNLLDPHFMTRSMHNMASMGGCKSLDHAIPTRNRGQRRGRHAYHNQRRTLICSSGSSSHCCPKALGTRAEEPVCQGEWERNET
jgi:hypothetical protein